MLNQLRDVFASFQRHEVKYLVIGGIAAVLYGVPRATFDLDILIEATPENARRLLDAMLDAELGTAALTSAADKFPIFIWVRASSTQGSWSSGERSHASTSASIAFLIEPRLRYKTPAMS